MIENRLPELISGLQDNKLSLVVTDNLIWCPMCQERHENNTYCQANFPWIGE